MYIETRSSATLNKSDKLSLLTDFSGEASIKQLIIIKCECGGKRIQGPMVVWTECANWA